VPVSAIRLVRKMALVEHHACQEYHWDSVSNANVDHSLDIKFTHEPTLQNADVLDSSSN
jgi:hypothetical protein